MFPQTQKTLVAVPFDYGWLKLDQSLRAFDRLLDLTLQWPDDDPLLHLP